MKKLSILFLGVIAMALFSSCKKVIGEGPVNTELRPVANFTSISSSVRGIVYYQQSANYKVEVSAQQNILDILETFVSGNELVIKFRNNRDVRQHEDIVIRISSPSINGVRVSGSERFVVSDPITTNSLNLTLSGSGNLRLQQVTASSLETNVSGSGNITVNTGAVDNERLRVSGSGDIDVSNVIAKTATVTTSGSGKIYLHATQTLDANISGSGSIYYSGNAVVDSHVSGSGRVIHQ